MGHGQLLDLNMDKDGWMNELNYFLAISLIYFLQRVPFSTVLFYPLFTFCWWHQSWSCKASSEWVIALCADLLMISKLLAVDFIQGNIRLACQLTLAVHNQLWQIYLTTIGKSFAIIGPILWAVVT